MFLLQHAKSLRIVASLFVIGLTACQPLPYSNNETPIPPVASETPNAPEMAATDTSTATVDLPTAEPPTQGYPGPELLPNQPPPCTFPSEKPTELPPFQDVQFSTPQLLLSGYEEIIQVLPDNHRVLLLFRYPEQNIYRFQTLDITSKETHIYADKVEDPYLISWLNESQSLAFVERKINPQEEKLWVSYGDPNSLQLVSNDLKFLTDTETPMPEMPQELAQYLRPTQLPVDPTQWQYNKYPQDERLAHFASYIPLEHALRPDGSMMAFYGFPWLFLVNMQTYEPCEVDIQTISPLGHKVVGLHATQAQWSSDGRFLAMLVEPEHFGRLLLFRDVAILDTHTGDWYESSFDFRYTASLAWLNDGRHLVVQGKVNDDGLRHIILIDAIAQTHKVLPFDQITQIYQGLNMRVRQNDQAQELIFMCGEGEHYGVCLSTITNP